MDEAADECLALGVGGDFIQIDKVEADGGGKGG